MQQRGSRNLSILWSRLVSGHSHRQLTLDSDKLPALTGVARQFQRTGMGIYLAGLWLEDLLYHLCWRPRGGDHGRPSTYRAPTWSWASTTGRVTWDMEIFDAQVEADVLSVERKLKGP
jgi:hypothetical protein